MTFPDGTIAGRYELGPVIGRGGMGEVRQARDLRLGREVAIKFLRPDLAADADVRRRFEGEARAAARLAHPNAVTVFDTGEHEGDPYIVMERLPGRTLADDASAGPLPIERVRETARGVLGALAAAHDAGIVHRDVKPANILLAADGTPKVADFGIAKSTEGLDHTLAGQVIGTATYLAPERLAGEPATPRSDLYSLGVVLYEILTGRPPFTGDTPLAVAVAVGTTEPPPLRQVRPEIAPELAAAVERAMDRDPERRFASAGEMAASLSGLPEPPVTEARPVMSPPEPTRSVKVSPTLSQPVVPSPPPAPGPARPGRSDRSWLLALAAVAIVAVVAVILFAAADGDPDGEEPPPVATGAPLPSAPGGSLPPALDDALRRLEEAVQP